MFDLQPVLNHISITFVDPYLYNLLPIKYAVLVLHSIVEMHVSITVGLLVTICYSNHSSNHTIYNQVMAPYNILIQVVLHYIHIVVDATCVTEIFQY